MKEMIISHNCFGLHKGHLRDEANDIAKEFDAWHVNYTDPVATYPGTVTAQSNQATIRKPWKLLAAVAFGLLLSVPGLAQTQYTFSTIDVPHAKATQINANSTTRTEGELIAGQFDDASGTTHGFVLKNGVFTTIDAPLALAGGVVPGVVGTIINGINASGQLVGTAIVKDNAGPGKPTSTTHAFFDNNGNFMTLDPVGVKSQGGFINTQGQVVGTYRDLNQYRHGFIWLNGTFTTFNVPGDLNPLGTVAFGINDSGAVVGDYVAASDQNRHGFLRSSNGVFTTLDAPNAAITVGEGINNAGTIVGAYLLANHSLHGFVWNNGVFTTVDVPNASGTEINSIDANGEIAGFYNDSEGVSHGFIGVPAQ